VQTITEKLLTYAPGRAVEYYGMPAVRQILRGASREDDRFRSIILGIVTSPPFQMRVRVTLPVDAADSAAPARLRLAQFDK
jgi:hypothetical protein